MVVADFFHPFDCHNYYFSYQMDEMDFLAIVPPHDVSVVAVEIASSHQLSNAVKIVMVFSHRLLFLAPGKIV